MKRLTLLLAALLVALQWPLWMGHGGWLRVWDLQRKLADQQGANAALRSLNRSYGAEIASLRQGSEAIEERARGELHMIRGDETFFQFRAPVREAQLPGAGKVASTDPLQFGAK